MGCKVIITRDFEHMSRVAAEIVSADIARAAAGPGSYVLGLAAGGSPTGMYQRLANAFNQGRLDARRITSFNLDEYIGLPGENAQARALHPESFSFFMVQELFGLLRKKFRETNVPWACLVDQDRMVAELKTHPDDWQEQGASRGRAVVIKPEARSDYLRWLRREVLDAYEAKIGRSGGIDLQVIGVGGRGHVAFHEAGIPFAGNRMLLVKLDDDTVANAVADGRFSSAAESPRYAISMGAELVYQAKRVLLLAAGSRKADPIAASLCQDATDAVPVSYGQHYVRRGGGLTYVLDHEAAAGVLAQRGAIESRGVTVEDVRDGEP